MADDLVAARQIADMIDDDGPGDWRIVVREAESIEPSVGVFCEGCEHEIFPGIRWPTRTNDDGSHEWVERCDNCERFDSDLAARDWLVENYGPDTIARDFVVGEAVPAGCSSSAPYLDGPR